MNQSSLKRLVGAKAGDGIDAIWQRCAVMLFITCYALSSVAILAMCWFAHGLDWALLISVGNLIVFAGAYAALRSGRKPRLIKVLVAVTSTASGVVFIQATGGIMGPGAVFLVGGPFAVALLFGWRGALLSGGGALLMIGTLAGLDPGVTSEPQTLFHLGLLAVATLVLAGFTAVTGAIFKQLLGEAETASAAAKRASDAKSRFLANMSHEIRTPLNGVLAMAQALEADELPRESREKIEVIHNSGELLLRVIDDVLDVSKIEAGAMTLENRPFDLGEVLRLVEELYAPTAEQKGIDLTILVADGLPLLRIGDHHRLAQVIGNLVSNALKFTARGRVVVEAVACGGGVRIEVADTGIGMTQDQAARVLEPFVQADDTITRVHGGTGLGLSIVKGLVETMGGGLSVSSELGAGTRFLLDLPLGEARSAGAGTSHKSPARSEVPSLKGRRLLIVDDNVVNLQVLKTLLSRTEASVVDVTGGELAIELASAESFDAILTDISMPGVDGIEAARRIWAHSGLNANTPIIAVTAHTLQHEVQALEEVGFHGYLAKPIRTSALFAELTRLLTRENELVERSRARLKAS